MALQHQCPSSTLLSIAHPAFVRDIDRAIQTLGGPEALRKLADDPLTSTLELRFRPSDRFEHPVLSTTARTTNLLIKVEKRTNEQDDQYLHHEPVAMVKCSVRFRGENTRVSWLDHLLSNQDMSDFQWNTSRSKFCLRLKEPLVTRDVRKLTAFTLSKDEDGSSGELDLIPPPIFSNTVVPHTYNYTQNPAAKKMQTDTGIRLVNRTRGLRQHLITVAFEDNTVPQGPSPKLPSNPSAEIANVVAKLEEIFAGRPIWTRRGVTNMLNQNVNFYNIKFALPYVSYMWRSGPWRDCYVRFGVDPRTDSSYGYYQAIYCMSKTIPNENEPPQKISQSHIFDGKTLYPRGRTFMFCDMTDPILTQIRDRAIKRTVPHPRDGWWSANMVQATRYILRGKLHSLCAGIIPSDLEYATTLEHANDSDDETDALRNLDVTGVVNDQDIEGEGVDPDLEEDTEDLDSRIKLLMKSLVRPGDKFNDGRVPLVAAEHRTHMSDISSSSDSETETL